MVIDGNGGNFVITPPVMYLYNSIMITHKDIFTKTYPVPNNALTHFSPESFHNFRRKSTLQRVKFDILFTENVKHMTSIFLCP